MRRSHPISIPYPTALFLISPPSQKRTEMPRPLTPSPSDAPGTGKARYWEATTTGCTNPCNRESSTSNPSRKAFFPSNRQVILQIEKTLALLDGTGTNDLSLRMRVAERGMRKVMGGRVTVRTCLTLI